MRVFRGISVGRSIGILVWAGTVLWPAPGKGTPIEPCGEFDPWELSRQAFDLSTRVRGGDIQPHWMADGNQFWFAESSSDRRTFVRVDPGRNVVESFFDEERLREKLATTVGHPVPGPGLPFETLHGVSGSETVRFDYKGRSFELHLETYALTERPKATEEEAKRDQRLRVRRASWDGLPDVFELPSPDGRWFLREEAHDLWLRSRVDSRSERLTEDGVEGFAWRMEDADGFAKAQFSSDGLWLAALKIDDRKVPRIPLVHWLKNREEVEWHPFTKAGGPLPRIELHLLDVTGRRARRVDTGEATDHFLMILGWAPQPDAPRLLFARIERDFRKVTVMSADPRTGEIEEIFVEEQQTFVKNISGRPAITDLFTLLDKSGGFLWISEQDGWDHLYLHDGDGRRIRRLTKGAWPVVRVEEVDESSGWVYFTAHGDKDRPYDTHLYRVGLDGQGFQQLTEEPGQHRALFSPSKAFFLDFHSSIARPPRVDLRRADGSFLRRLSEADVQGLEEICWKPPEPFVVKAADGHTDLHGLLYKPWHFDPQDRYPVLDYIYAGPSTTWVPWTFADLGIARGGRARSMAQLGFVVVLVDGRGTPERGKAFQDVVYGNFGRHEIPDHVATLRQLAAGRPWMDLERVGVFGGSWGGYMTIRALLMAPEVFKVGFATNALVDLYDHGAVGLEGYLGLLTENPEAYAYGSNLQWVDRLEGRLLLAHSTGDRNVTFSTSMKMVEALVRAGKPYDLLVFPGQGHLLDGVSQRYRLEAMRSYFTRHLLDEAPMAEPR